MFFFQWTLMGYMIEGGGSKTMAKSKGWLEDHTTESHKLLKTLTAVIIEYLLMQVSTFLALMTGVGNLQRWPTSTFGSPRSIYC